MPCVYILYSGSTNKFYIGSSREGSADRRLKSHNTGKSKSTKAGRPWSLIYEERCSDYTEARKKENYLKSGVGRGWIKEKFKNSEGWPSGLRRRS
ncbi:MAG: GIY-YIG nuclease family protein [Deltaproteobacteria bacterium]|nr:GIY-YIG nuclease family protein [Deltaproteobacteria bacterium]